MGACRPSGLVCGRRHPPPRDPDAQYPTREKEVPTTRTAAHTLRARCTRAHSSASRTHHATARVASLAHKPRRHVNERMKEWKGKGRKGEERRGEEGSSALRKPHAKSPCVRAGGSGQGLPAGSPIVGSRTSPVQSDDAVNNYIRLGPRRLRDCRHLRRREGGHQRNCVSVFTSRHWRSGTRGECSTEKNPICTLGSTSGIPLMECGHPGFSVLAVSRSSVKIYEHTAACYSWRTELAT